MASNTSYINLYKKDPVADRNDTFNITTMLNENWDKLDTALFNMNKDKVDKIVGKSLSTNDFTNLLKDKLDGIAEGANKYTHPDSHSLDIITETTAKKIMTNLERAKLEGIEIGATNYNHPAAHPAAMITESTAKRFTSDTEKAKWNKTTTDLALTDAEVLANKTNLGTHLADSASYSTYKLNPDSEGVFTEIHYKRPDSTLILKSILSGGTSPQYATRTEIEYEQNGTTIKDTRTYTIAYDEDGKVISEVLQ